MAYEAFLDEGFEHVELRGRHLLSCVEPAAAGEDGEPREEPLLALVEQLVAPLDRRAERLLTSVGVAGATEEVEAPLEPAEDLRRGEDVGARRRELDGEREIVERGADGDHGLVHG